MIDVKIPQHVVDVKILQLHARPCPGSTPIYLSIYLSFYLSILLSIYLSIYLSNLFIYLYINKRGLERVHVRCRARKQSYPSAAAERRGDNLIRTSIPEEYDLMTSWHRFCLS